MQCWCLDPSERPMFQSLVCRLSGLLERESGYLDLSQSLCWKSGPEIPLSSDEAMKENGESKL